MKYRMENLNFKENENLISAIFLSMAILFIKIDIKLSPVALLSYVVYQFSLWHNKCFDYYNGNWSDFYHVEFKYRLQNTFAIVLTMIGIILYFSYPATGIIAILTSVPIYLKIDVFLKNIFKDRYNLRIKRIFICTLGFIGLGSIFYYHKVEKDKIEEYNAIKIKRQVELETKIAEEKAIKIKQQEEFKIKKDESDKLNYQAKVKVREKNYKKALTLIDSSLHILPTNLKWWMKQIG